MEYLIEKHKTVKGLNPKENKRYIPMFKTGSTWTFSLPIQDMYLMTIKDCKLHISKMLKYKGMPKKCK